MRNKPIECEIDFDDPENPKEDYIAKIYNIQVYLQKINNSYIGNKRKILSNIAYHLNDNKYYFNSLLDLFSGSGMVSLFFRMLGKKVTANDILKSSFYNAFLFLENDKILSDNELYFLCNNNTSNKKGFITNKYSSRFTSNELIFLENYRANIDLLDNESKKIIAFVMMQNHIIKNCFLGGRLNSGQVLAKLDHRLNHIRNKTTSPLETSEMSFILENIPVFDGPIGKAINSDCLNAIDLYEEKEMIYIDPPYGGSQSDYMHMFSFFEEFIHNKDIQEIDYFNNSKKFSNKKTYKNSFIEILEKSKEINQWAISFNNSSWANIDDISNIVKKFKNNVIIIDINYSYKYRKNNSAIEYLILAK